MLIVKLFNTKFQYGANAVSAAFTQFSQMDTLSGRAYKLTQ